MSYVQVAAEGDPEVQTRFHAIIDRRRSGIRRMFETLEARGALRMPAAQAADTYFLLANPELQTLSSTSLGWTPERYKAWTWEMAVTQLLRDAEPRPEVVRDLSFAAALPIGPSYA